MFIFTHFRYSIIGISFFLLLFGMLQAQHIELQPATGGYTRILAPTTGDTAMFISPAKTIRFRPGVNGLAIGPAGSEHLYINGTNGFVGINTTDPKSRLQIGERTHFYSVNVAGDNFSVYGYNAYWNGSSLTRPVAGTSSILSMGENSSGKATYTLYQFAAGAANSNFAANSADYSLLFSEGMLGINQTSPVAGIHLQAPMAPAIRLDMAASGDRPELQLMGNANYFTAIRSADLLTANYTLTLPAEAGTNGQVLKNQGSGTLDWGNLDAIVDADADTYVQVEKSPDEDIIRFSIKSVQQMILQNNPNGVPQLLWDGTRIFIGDGAGAGQKASQSDNTAIGYNALYSNNTGSGNTALGSMALNALGIGSSNVAIGSNAMANMASGGGNVAIGESTLRNVNGNYQIGIGYQAGLYGGGDNNIAIGNQAGNNVSAKTYNSTIFIGKTAGYSNQANDNVFIGHSSGYANTAGNQNTFIGFETGGLGTLASRNAFVGWRAGKNNNADQNTFMGSEAGRENTTANNNTFIGAEAGRFTTTGKENTFLGATAGTENTIGQNNVFVGYGAGYLHGSGDNNVFIGDLAGSSNASGSGNVFIGSRAGENETGSDKLYIDNSNTTTPLIKGDFASNKLTINGDEIVTGVQSASDYNYSTAKVHYISVPGAAFSSISNAGNVVKDNTGPFQPYVYLTGSSKAVAPLYLPDGATIQEVQMFFDTDVTVFSPIAIELMLMNTTATTLGTTSYVGGATATMTQVTNTISGGHIVNNQNNSYMLMFVTPNLNVDCKLYRAVVKYSVASPD